MIISPPSRQTAIARRIDIDIFWALVRQHCLYFLPLPHGHRIATCPREGRKVFTLQTLPASPDEQRKEIAESSGFSLHASIAAKASQREKLEHLARYVARPPVATERLSLTEGGRVRCALKTPYRDGTTHVIFEPEDFIARPAALVPKPRAHRTRYHGVFAPASRDRARVHREVGPLPPARARRAASLRPRPGNGPSRGRNASSASLPWISRPAGAVAGGLE